jgi:hypothetical protein
MRLVRACSSRRGSTSAVVPSSPASISRAVPARSAAAERLATTCSTSSRRSVGPDVHHGRPDLRLAEDEQVVDEGAEALGVAVDDEEVAPVLLRERVVLEHLLHEAEDRRRRRAAARGTPRR